MMDTELEILREIKGDSDDPNSGEEKYKWVALADILEALLERKAENEDLQTKLDLAGEINKSLEIQVGQLGEMNRDLEIQLSDKTKACEAQHEMIKRLEAENAALEQRLV